MLLGSAVTPRRFAFYLINPVFCWLALLSVEPGRLFEDMRHWHEGAGVGVNRVLPLHRADKALTLEVLPQSARSPAEIDSCQRPSTRRAVRFAA